MLVTELARRGLSDADVVRLLQNATVEKLCERARVVFRALHFGGRDSQVERVFDPALKMYLEVGDPARQAVEELFRAAKGQMGCSAKLEDGNMPHEAANLL